MFSRGVKRINGVSDLDIYDSNLYTGQPKRIKLEDGTEDEPSVFFSGSTTTGLYRTADDKVGVALSGAETYCLGVTQFWANAPVRDVYNVKKYGAVGDGVTDDLSAIQAGVDYVIANGGALYFEAGTYMVSGTVSVDTNVFPMMLFGEGTIKRLSGTGTVIQFDDCDGVGLSGLTIDGNATAVASGNHGVALDNCVNVLLFNLTITDYANSAILALSSTPGWSEKVYAISCVVDGNEIANNGLNFVDVHDCTMVNCLVKNIPAAASPGYALQLKNDCTRCSIENCTAVDCRYGIAFGWEAPATGVNNCRVSNCNVLRCDNNAFVAGNAVSCLITNLILDMDSLGNESIRLGGGGIGTGSGIDSLHFYNILARNTASPKDVIRLDTNVIDTTFHGITVSPSYLNVVRFNAASCNRCFVEVVAIDDQTDVNPTSVITANLGSNNVVAFRNSFTSPLLFQDGSTTAPSIGFHSNTDCGVYLASGPAVSTAINGADVLSVKSGGVTVSGDVEVGGENQVDNGGGEKIVFSELGSTVATEIENTTRLEVNTAGVTVNGGIIVGSDATITNNGGESIVFNNSGNTIGFHANGSQVFNIGNKILTMDEPLELEQYTTGNYPSAPDGSLIYSSTLSKVLFRAGGSWYRIDHDAVPVT